MMPGTLIRVSDVGMLSIGVDPSCNNVGIALNVDETFFKLTDLPVSETCWKVFINKNIEIFYEQDLEIL